jgi:hypothetical protein
MAYFRSLPSCGSARMRPSNGNAFNTWIAFLFRTAINPLRCARDASALFGAVRLTPRLGSGPPFRRSSTLRVVVCPTVLRRYVGSSPPSRQPRRRSAWIS